MNAQFIYQAWCSGMATAHFSSLIRIHGDDVNIKGCEFHYKQTVARRAKALGHNRLIFQDLVYNLL